MKRFYLMPIILVDGERQVKYPTSSYRAADYGNEPVALVVADVTPKEHTALAAHADVVAVPANLDTAIGGSLTQAQSALETFGIPADWLNAGMTWRIAVGGVFRIFQLFQRIQGHRRTQRVLSGGVDLSTQFNSLPFDVRAHLIVMADSLDFDRSGVSGTSTLRQILRSLASQWTGPVRLWGIEL